MAQTWRPSPWVYAFCQEQCLHDHSHITAPYRFSSLQAHVCTAHSTLSHSCGKGMAKLAPYRIPELSPHVLLSLHRTLSFIYSLPVNLQSPHPAGCLSSSSSGFAGPSDPPFPPWCHHKLTSLGGVNYHWFLLYLNELCFYLVTMPFLVDLSSK